MPRIVWFIFLLAATVVALLDCRLVGLTFQPRQIESLTIFAGLVYGILMFEQQRLPISLGGVALVLGLGLLTLDQFIASAGLDVVLFLLGTFLVAGFLEECGLFERLVGQIVQAVGPRPQLLLASLMLAAMIASAIVGEVAAILFVGGAMLHIASRCRLNPAPFLMMLVFATNTGSAATAFGPVGVTIALKAHLTVLDFFRWATPIAVVVLGAVFWICRWWFARDWRDFAAAIQEHHEALIAPDGKHDSHASAGWLLVIAMVVLLIFHAQIEHALHLSDNVMLLATALGAGCAALLLSGDAASEILEKRVDWGTLAFFLMLFSVVGALQASGVTSVLAGRLMSVTGGHAAPLVLIVGWATGLLSALLANMLAVATFVPIVADLKAHGATCPAAIYWLMLFGATFMGNMTSIGSTCNIIACGMAEKRGLGPIGFVRWLKIGLIVSLVSMALATILLALQTHGLSRG